MEKRIKLLDEIVVAAPCPVRWESMTGDDRVRHCCGCSRNVFNISDMTSSEAEEFLAKNGVSQCLQIYRRPDGKIMTDNCPRALRPLRNKCRAIVQGATAVVASLVALIPVPRAAAQSESLRGDAYIPPAKNNSQQRPDNKNAPMLRGETLKRSETGSSCKKQIMLGGEDCNEKTKTEQPVGRLGGEPVMAPGMVMRPSATNAGENAQIKGNMVLAPHAGEKTAAASLRPGAKGSVSSVRPIAEQKDLRDSKALNLYRSAQQSAAEGKTLLAQTQYLEALKAATLQKDGDPKFRQLIQQACNKLRGELHMQSVDLNGNEIK